MEHMDHTSLSGAAVPAPTRPEHGTWEGHILPGSFFIVWSLWWLFSNFRLQFKATGKKAYKSRAWFEFPLCGSKWPVEPFLKVLFPFIGINMELWAGHISYRRMYDPDTGKFEQNNIQDWQHAGMYAAFMISGMVDLIGYYTTAGTLPSGTEQAVLGTAFLVEGFLFGFHLKGTALDQKVHLILVMTIFALAFVCFLEISNQQHFLLTTARAQLTMLQGLWFCQIATILFTENPAWNPNLHASVMMAPFFFVLWIMLVALLTVLVFTGTALYFQRCKNYRPISRDEENWPATNGHSHSPERV